MSNQNNKRYGEPLVVDPNGSLLARPKRRLLTQRDVNEKWLQELIRRYPELLPAAEVAPEFSPLVSVGVEVPTKVGPIDNLFLSPDGYLTLAETKLWRNPEARREVVGQIIDYAKELRSWSYQDLEGQVRLYNRRHWNSDAGILDTIRRHEEIDDSREALIVDTLSNNLQRGRFLLLVVGDGIRESVETIAEFLSSTPQLQFTLALVELELYDIPEDDGTRLLVVPHVVAKTREVIRAVVTARGTAAELVEIGPDTQRESPLGSRRRRYTLSEEDYFEQLGQNVGQEDVAFARKMLEDMEALGCVTDWQAASYVIKLRDPGGSGKLLTILVVPKRGGAYAGWLGGQLRSLGLPEDIGTEFIGDVARLFGIGVKEDGFWNGDVSLKHLSQKYGEFTQLVQQTIDRITAASNESSNEGGLS